MAMRGPGATHSRPGPYTRPPPGLPPWWTSIAMPWEPPQPAPPTPFEHALVVHRMAQDVAQESVAMLDQAGSVAKMLKHVLQRHRLEAYYCRKVLEHWDSLFPVGSNMFPPGAFDQRPMFIRALWRQEHHFAAMIRAIDRLLLLADVQSATLRGPWGRPFTVEPARPSTD